MTATEPSAETSLANRYGGQKRALSRRGTLLLIAAALALAVGLLAWFGISSSINSVSFKDTGYKVVDATATDVEFQVTKDAGSTAKCAVKAMDEAFAVVGWKVVTIGPDAPGAGPTTNHQVRLRTESLAVSGMVDRCWIDAGAS